jgi:hypothetical protein
MFGNFLLRKMMKSKMQGVPPETQEQILTAIEKNPDFFTKIAGEIKAKMDGGKDQMAATLEVMESHNEALQALMKK